MTVGIIGSGMIGSQVARLCVAAGIDVVICNSRGPQTLTGLVAELGPRARAATLAGVAATADLIVLAVPFGVYPRLPADLLAGAIVIDTTNYYPQRDGVLPEVHTDLVTTSELLQQQLSRSRVVRALNNMDFAHLVPLARPAGAADRSALPLAADDAASAAVVIDFLNRIGYDALNIGTLADSWRSAPTTPIYVLPYRRGPVSMAAARILVDRAVRNDRMVG